MTEFLQTNGGIMGSASMSQPGDFAQTVDDSPSTSRQQFDDLSLRMFNQVNQENVGVGAWELAGRYAMAVPTDVADSVWSSPLNPFSSERGEVWAHTSQDQKDYYERNKGLVEGSSAIVGGIATAVFAEAAVIPLVTRGIMASSTIVGSRAWQAGSKMNAATLRGMQSAQLKAIETGAEWSVWSSSEGLKVLGAQALTTSAKATRTLPIDYAVMWNNEAFNSGNLAEEAMWLGLGGSLGAAAGIIRGRGMSRQFMNSAEARTQIAQRFTGAGTTNSLLNSTYLGGIPTNERVDFMQQMKGSTEASVYLNMGYSGLEGGAEASQVIIEEANTMRSIALGMAGDATQKILARGVSGVPIIKGLRKTDPTMKHLIHNVAKTDPNVMFGMTEMGRPDLPFAEAVKARTDWLDSEWAKSQALPGFEAKPDQMKQAAQVSYLRKQQGFAYANGTWYDPENAMVEAIRGHDDGAAKALTHIDKDTAVIHASKMVRKKGQIGSDIRIGINMAPMRGARRVPVATMGWEDRFALQAGASKFIDSLVSDTNKSAKVSGIVIKDKDVDDWFQLDMINELIERGGGKRVTFDGKNITLNSQQDIQRHSLRIKARTLLRDVGPTGEITAEMRLRFNLPSPTTMENWDDPMGDNFRKWLEFAAGDVGTNDELSKGLSAARSIGGYELLPTAELTRPRLDGDGLKFNRSDDGEWMAPMLGYFEPKQQMGSNLRNAMDERLMMEKSQVMAILQNTNRSAYLGELSKTLVASDAYKAVHKVNELHKGQNTGLGGQVSQAVSEFLPKHFLSRDNIVMKAAYQIQQVTEAAGRIAYNKLMETHGLTDLVTRLSSRSGLGLSAELDQYASLRPGYDIKKAVDVDGRVGFELENSQINRDLLGVDNIKEGTLLSNLRTGDSITLSPEAAQIVDQFNGLTDDLLNGTNMVRAAAGQSELSRKLNFMPSPDTKGKLVGFLRGPDGSLVTGNSIVASTKEEYTRKMNQMLDEFGDGYSVMSKEQARTVRDVTDLEGMDWVDSGFSANSRQGSQAGGLNPTFTKVGSFLDAVDWAGNQVKRQHQDSLKIMMRQPLQISRMRSATARATANDAAVGAGKEGLAAPTRNIYDEFEKALLGNSQSYDETAILAKASKGFENLVDNIGIRPLNHVLDMAKRFNYDTNKLKGAKTYKQVLEQLGEHSPYKDADDWIQAQGIRKPLSVRKVSQKINQLATNVILRWDPGMAHASMNMLGLIPTLLAGTHAGSAPATMSMNVKGKRIPMVDSMQLIKGAMGDMLKVRGREKGGRLLKAKAGNADWDEMVKNGDASQSAYEYHTQLGAIENQSGWHEWANKIDGALAWASDPSENMSRQMSHFVGLRVADAQGIKGMTARHDFAREFANASIADYAPSNRPELYQTSFGAVFGLFQSYAMGQFTKMFHWLEHGDYRSFGVQAAAQASMFGVAGTYGSNLVFGLHDKIYQESGDPSLMDSLYAQFGPTVGNAMAHGGIAEISKIALWTRGDMEPRMPIVSGMAPPGVDVIMRSARMFTGTVEQFLTNLPQDAIAPALENIQREMPNRMLKGIIGQIQGGQETDRSGNIATESQDWFESILRVAGVRSTRQQVELESYYAGKGAITRDAVRREKVRNQFRTDVRSAARSGNQIDPLKYFDGYVASGGNPQSFPSWAKGIVRDAGSSRGAATLRKNLTTPRNALEQWRYTAYGAWPLE